MNTKETLIGMFYFISTIILLVLASYMIAILFIGFVAQFSGNIELFKTMLNMFSGGQNEVQLAFMTGIFTVLAAAMLIQLGIEKGAIEVN